MKTQKLVKMGFAFAAFLAAILVFANAVQAQQNWNATVGGQSADMSKQAAAFLESLADTAIKETRKSGVFVVPGLGRLVKAHRKARIGRNPQTGEPIQIKAKTVVKFRVAKAAKDAIAPKK